VLLFWKVSSAQLGNILETKVWRYCSGSYRKRHSFKYFLIHTFEKMCAHDKQMVWEKVKNPRAQGIRITPGLSWYCLASWLPCITRNFNPSRLFHQSHPATGKCTCAIWWYIKLFKIGILGNLPIAHDSLWVLEVMFIEKNVNLRKFYTVHMVSEVWSGPLVKTL
jgi:hypothetical protein